jgi:hypothetical protein
MTSCRGPYSGGLEYLFAKQKKIQLEFATASVTIRDVLAELKAKHLKERPELFMQGDTVYATLCVCLCICGTRDCEPPSRLPATATTASLFAMYMCE